MFFLWGSSFDENFNSLDLVIGDVLDLLIGSLCFGEFNNNSNINNNGICYYFLGFMFCIYYFI